MTKPFKGKYGPLLIAEIGGNHEGDFEYAKKLTQLAIKSGADYIKFQLYTGDSLVSPIESPVRNKHFKKFELSKEQHIELAKMIGAAGRKYTASVWDMDMIEWIDEYIPIYKIGSGDLTAYPVLARIAKIGKPIIISTGLSTEEEVFEAIKYIQTIDDRYKQKEYLAVLQCTSMYPIKNSDANLKVMQHLKEQTGLTVGYSDHTEDMHALKYAVAMGAEILEFHFTDTKTGKDFRDHKVSLTCENVKELIAEIELINTLKGNNIKKPLPIELENGHEISFRRAVYLNKNMNAGDTISEEDLCYLRPNHGIDAREFHRLIGKTLLKDIRAFEQLNWNLLQ